MKIAVPSEVPRLENVPSALVISKIHNRIFKVIYSHSHDSITSSTTLQLPVILLDPILVLGVGIVLITQEFPVIVNPYLFAQLTFMLKSPRAILSRNIITTRFRQFITRF